MADSLKDLIDKLGGELTEDERADLERISAEEEPPTIPESLTNEPEPAPPGAQEPGDTKDLRTLIAEMKLPEKIKLAMFGNSVCRSLLINDTNRMVQMFVLRNPKLRQPEIEDFAKNSNMSEHVLRAIGDHKEWMKTYALKCLLVTNPRTPADVALKWLRYINTPELKKIAKSKNVPQLVAVTAKKRLADMERK